MAKTYRNIKSDLEGHSDWKAARVKRDRKAQNQQQRLVRMTKRVAIAMAEQD